MFSEFWYTIHIKLCKGRGLPSLFSKSVRFLWIIAFAAGLRAPILCDFLGAVSEISRRDVCPCGGHANWSLYSVLNFEIAFRSIPDCLSYKRKPKKKKTKNKKIVNKMKIYSRRDHTEQHANFWCYVFTVLSRSGSESRRRSRSGAFIMLLPPPPPPPPRAGPSDLLRRDGLQCVPLRSSDWN